MNKIKDLKIGDCLIEKKLHRLVSSKVTLKLINLK